MSSRIRPEIQRLLQLLSTFLRSTHITDCYKASKVLYQGIIFLLRHRRFRNEIPDVLVNFIKIGMSQQDLV